MAELNKLSAYPNRFSAQISQHCVRAQIVAYYSSLSFLLDDIPSIRQSHFGQSGETKAAGSAPDLRPEPRYNHEHVSTFQTFIKRRSAGVRKRQKQENESK